MAENQQTIIWKNVLTWRGIEKLYLDRETSDIFFVFNSKTDDCEMIPAHKCILSGISPAFRAMFFGPAKQDGDIEIVDSTPEAFKEFLQFFYRTSVQLTPENIVSVMNLGKQYLIEDCVKASSEFSLETLSSDNLCSSYELAILFDLDELKTRCEQRIRDNPVEFFESESFLNCESNMLRQILRSKSLNLDASALFDGCMAWAKNACKRNALNEKDPANIRSQLNELFYEIPFDKMTSEVFGKCYDLHGDLFSLEDYRDITRMIVTKNFQSVKFMRHPCTPINSTKVTELVCNRSLDRFKFLREENVVKDTIFQSNHDLLLTRLHFRKLRNKNSSLEYPVELKIFENIDNNSTGKLCVLMEVRLHESGDRYVELLSPIVITKDIYYKIDIVFSSNNIKGEQHDLANDIELENGIRITFKPKFFDTDEFFSSSSRFELISRLDFTTLP